MAQGVPIPHPTITATELTATLPASAMPLAPWEDSYGPKVAFGGGGVQWGPQPSSAPAPGRTPHRGIPVGTPPLRTPAPGQDMARAAASGGERRGQSRPPVAVLQYKY